MELVSVPLSKRVNQWNKNYISPGAVGAVGDVIMNVKLKQSAPDLPPRYQYKNIDKMGANVTDGQNPNWQSHGLGAKTIEDNYFEHEYEMYQTGYEYQDLRENDLTVDTRMLARPQDYWKTQAATTFNAVVSGPKFLPVPFGYPKAGQPRGANGPYHHFLSAPDFDVVDTGAGPNVPNPTGSDPNHIPTPIAPVAPQPGEAGGPPQNQQCPVLGQSRTPLGQRATGGRVGR